MKGAMIVAAVGLGSAFLSPLGAQNAERVPLAVVLPKPNFAGTPSNSPVGSNVEKPLGRPRPVPMVPRGTVNLALRKKVTAAKPPFDGALELVTDGDKEAREGGAVELKPGLQWVQIDLGAPGTLHYLLVWHYHRDPVVFHKVIAQVSNDPNFIDGVTTLYNNDQDNTAGMGIGRDREYWETSEGRLIEAKGVKARYVRLYSKGSTYQDPLNRYTEVEVWGQPAR